MGKFYDAIRADGAGPTVEGPTWFEPREYVVAGRPLKCPHCAEMLFLPGYAVFNSGDLARGGIAWTGSGATALVCAECGRVEWFVLAPETDLSRVTHAGPEIDLSQIRDLD